MIQFTLNLLWFKEEKKSISVADRGLPRPPFADMSAKIVCLLTPSLSTIRRFKIESLRRIFKLNVCFLVALDDVAGVEGQGVVEHPQVFILHDDRNILDR